MRPCHSTARIKRSAARGAALGLVLLVSAACTMNGASTPFGGIGFREARYQEISALREFRACRDEAMELDTQARSSGSPGRYLASANLFEKCESELGPETSGLATDERMRAYGLSIQNYIKAGEVAKARENLERYRAAFPKNDLYYTDGSSFIATMEVLLGQVEPWELGEYAALNVSQALKSEMRRVRYWKHK